MNFINCYNKLEIDRINELMKANPMLAKFEIEKYLTKFPNYYWGYVMQANILIILGEIQKANEVLNFLEEKINIKKGLKKDVRKLYIRKITNLRLRILAYNQNYETIYNFLLNNKDFIMEEKLSSEWFYIRILTGNLNDELIPGYLANQIANYNENYFRNHIQKHFVLKTQENSVFSENFPLEKVLEILPNYLKTPGLFYDYVTDKYIFRLDGVGSAGGIDTDLFEVITIHGTDHIINMYPTLEGTYTNSIDLNYIVNKDYSRKLSQIDKFNQRYKKK